jgi:hypothetical protein
MTPKIKWIPLVLLLIWGACKSKPESVQVEEQLVCDTVYYSYADFTCGITEAPCIENVRQHPDDSIFEYGVRAKLPQLLGFEADGDAFNKRIEADFKATIEAESKQALVDTNHYYQVEYKVLTEDSVLTLVVVEQHAYYRSEGLIRYGVYHFDFKNGKCLNTTDMLQVWGMSRVPLINFIVETAIQPGSDGEPDYLVPWIDSINANIDLMKMYRNSQRKLVVLYPWYENPLIENSLIIE